MGKDSNTNRNLVLEKVISGGQTGVDRAALRAAKLAGLMVGGWMPAGFKAQDGNHPEFKEIYDMKCTVEETYPPRTAMNVRTSDATLKFASDFSSRGEVLTQKLVIYYKKPYLDIPVNIQVVASMDEVEDFIRKEGVRVLNVAGNSERTSPGIGTLVEDWLTQFFTRVQDRKKHEQFS